MTDTCQTSLAQPTPFSEGNQHAAYLTGTLFPKIVILPLIFALVHLAYGADPKQVAAAAANIQKIVEKVIRHVSKSIWRSTSD